MAAKSPQNSMVKSTAMVLFFVAAHLAVTLGAPLFFSSSGLITLFWPASGIALAAVLAGGYRYALATLFSCMLAAILVPDKGIAQVLFSAANALEILIAPYLLLRLAKIDISFDKATDYLKFIFYAGILLPVPASVIAATTIETLTRSDSPFWLNALQWWMSDSLGILLLAPLLLIWRHLPSGWFSRNRIFEGAMGLLLTIAGSYYFLGIQGQFGNLHNRAYLFFIGVAWAATRFGRHATLLVTTIVIAFAIASMRSNAAIPHGQTFNFVDIWLFLITLSTVGMALATTFNERRMNMFRLSELLEAYRREELRRREADAALKRSNIDFQRLVETSAEGVWTIDAEGKTTFVNARLTEMLGYGAADMLGKTFFDFMAPEEHGAGSERLQRRKSGEAEAHECTLIHKNGNSIRTFMNTNPVKDSSGKVTGALAMVTDITERKKAESSLRESEDRYRKIVEGISDSILVHQSGIIQYANPAAAAIMGFEKADSLIGLNGFSFVHPDDRSMIIERAQQLVQGKSAGPLPPVRQRMVHPDGKIISIESTTTKIRFNGRDAMLVIAHQVKDSEK